MSIKSTLTRNLFNYGLNLILLFLILPASSGAQQIDLLLKGGHVIDPKNNINAKMDVAIVAGKIFRVAADIPANTARRTVNVSGL